MKIIIEGKGGIGLKGISFIFEDNERDVNSILLTIESDSGKETTSIKREEIKRLAKSL